MLPPAAIIASIERKTTNGIARKTEGELRSSSANFTGRRFPSPQFQCAAFARTDPMSFLNLRIRGRLYGGFGALLLFCVALAGFAVWQLWGIETQVGMMTLQSKNTIRVGDIATELQATRRGLLRYTFDQDEASFAESEKRLSRVADLLEEAVRTTIVE